MKHKIAPKNMYAKRFCDALEKIAVNHSLWTVWQHFINIAAISLANTMEMRTEIRTQRESLYHNIINQYTTDEQQCMVEMMSLLIQGYIENPNQDFLGDIYMSLDFGDGWKGQFFTPWHVAEMMARGLVGNPEKDIKEKGYVSVCDPTCGSGVMLLAFASVFNNETGCSYNDNVLFVGQDIDPTVAKMTFIQLSLIGAAGYVKIGDALKDPITTCDMGENVWFTPAYFSPSWIGKITASTN